MNLALGTHSFQSNSSKSFDLKERGIFCMMSNNRCLREGQATLDPGSRWCSTPSDGNKRHSVGSLVASFNPFPFEYI